MRDEYITTRDGGYWIGESRVALDSVVYRFLEGLSPESIAESFAHPKTTGNPQLPLSKIETGLRRVCEA